ncbi:MAG: AsmA-like C-terminal region-containing protein [Chthoniobacteraceae bacterium]
MRRFLQITFLLLLLAAGIGGRYLYNRGLTKSWREWVVEEVRKHGVEVSFARLTVRPFRGLVAKDVKIYESPARKRVIAHMNEMVIEANYANAAKHRPFLDALTLVDTSLQIPLDPQNPFGPSVRVDRLNARILFPPEQIQVTRFDAVVFGIRVRASGSLLVPPDVSFARDKTGANTGLAETIAREFGALKFDGPAPELTVHFSGDLGHRGDLSVEAQFTGEKIRRGRYTLASLALSAIWQNDVLLLQRLDAADAKGRLQASGSFEPKARTAEVRLRSSLDLPALLRALNVTALDDFAFPSPPKLDLTARAEFDAEHKAPPKLQALGHAGVGSFSYGGVRFESLSADVSWEGRRWAVRDFALLQENGGELTGNAQQDYDASGRGDFRLGLTSNLSPQAVAPLLKPETRAKIAQLKFHEAPRITLSARGTAPGLDTLSVSGGLKLGRTTYRGVEARSAETTFRYSGRVLSLDSFEVHRAEGSGKGHLAIDFRTGLYYLKDVKASVFPAEVALWIDQDLVHDVKPYRFGKRPPNLQLDGTIDPAKGGTHTRLTVIADAPGGMDYTFCKKDLHFGEIKGHLFFTDERLKLTDVRGELFGGTLTADGDVSIVKARPGEAATVKLAGVDFAKLSKLYFGFDDSKGKLDGTCTFTGKGDEALSIRGEGEVSVTEGNVFAIPFLGPLSDILNKIVPGMGYSRAHKATATFTMGDGILSNKDLVIAGNGFSMYGGGRIWMVEDKIDYDIRINARGLPGVLLFPVSKLLEYRANSRFTKPDWRPKALQGARQ